MVAVAIILLLHGVVEALILHRHVVVKVLLTIAQVAVARGLIPEVVAVLLAHLLAVALLEARDDKIIII